MTPEDSDYMKRRDIALTLSGTDDLARERSEWEEVALKLKPTPRGGTCPKCGVALSADVGLRLVNRRLVPTPLAERSRVNGEPREEHVPEVPPTLLPTFDSVPPEVLREWHRISRDNLLLKAGDFRCADRVACEARFRAEEL